MQNRHLLSSLDLPLDVKKLTYPELGNLAQEVRERIIEVMSVNGGHLASNLGSVELTVALHHCFNSPDDKFIWDVSHQTYAHKILTGRNEAFSKVRQYKGVSGFANPKESPHDHFYAGHAGTALSLALGVLKNRDLTGRQDHVIPIIGDATLTCGMSLEALNNISKEQKNLIVILNDNRMSISKNVGAITHILSRLISNPTTDKIYHEIDALVSKIPSYGSRIAKHGHKVTESLKNLFSPAAFFEQYGLSYIGPIDGHDIKKLCETFDKIKNQPWPIILHVLTNKGHGMEAASSNPISYHGVRPFDLNTGKFHAPSSSQPTFPKVFGSYLVEMGKKDPSIVVTTPAMSSGSCLDDFMTLFPSRCLDVGIAEAHSLTYAGGIAYGKKVKVFASIYATFLQRALDNLFHDVCVQELPVVFAIDRAGLSPADGTTHHGIYDIGFLNAMPNMVIAQPRHGDMLKQLMESCFSWQRPTAIRYPNLATETSSECDLRPRPLGKGEILKKGSKLLLVGLGHMCGLALEIRQALLAFDIEATVVDPIFVKPLDEELFLELLETHPFVVTLEEHALSSGFGSILNNFFIKTQRPPQVLNLGIPDLFLEQGTYAELMNEVGLNVRSISQRIKEQFPSLFAAQLSSPKNLQPQL